MSGASDDQLHVLVADVIKAFDTVDRFILDCTLGRLGLPQWVRTVCLAYHSHVRLKCKLAAGLGNQWCQPKWGGIPQGCPWSMIFMVFWPWCGRLEGSPLGGPQVCADNLNCSSVFPRALFDAARNTVRYVQGRWAGHLSGQVCSSQHFQRCFGRA